MRVVYKSVMEQVIATLQCQYNEHGLLGLHKLSHIEVTRDEWFKLMQERGVWHSDKQQAYTIRYMPRRNIGDHLPSDRVMPADVFDFQIRMNPRAT